VIYRVAPNDLAVLWPQVAPLVVAALRGTPTHDAEDVRKTILAGNATLFVQFRDNRVEAIVVTEFVTFPKGVWINMWLLAAADPHVPLSIEAFHPVLEVFRIHNGARGFQYCGGRHGWLKRFPNLVVEGINTRWTLD
jgi:hypothetical protein